MWKISCSGDLDSGSIFKSHEESANEVLSNRKQIKMYKSLLLHIQMNISNVVLFFLMKMVVGFPPLVWFVFLISVSQAVPLGPSAQSLHMWAVYRHRIRPLEWTREVDTPVLSHSVPCALFPLFSDIMGHTSQPHFNSAVLERGGEDGEQKQHNIDFETHSDFRCLQN